MKRFLFIQVILICIAIPSFAQKKIEKYCVFATYPSNKERGKLEIIVVRGDVDYLFSFKDSSLQTNLINIATTLKKESDLLNYMASQGWSLVAYTSLTSQYQQRHLIFKKEFDLSELKSSQ